MYRLILLLLCLLLPGSAWGDKKPLIDRKKAAKIREMVYKLERSRSNHERMQLAEKLIDYGPAVIPHLEEVQQKYQRKLYIYLYILQSVRQKKKIPYNPPAKTTEGVFVEKRIRWLEKALKDQQYKKALKLSKALLTLLKTKSPYHRQVVRLKIRAEERFLRKYVLVSEFKVKSRVFTKGQVLTVGIVLRNVSKKMVKLTSTVNKVVGQVIINEQNKDIYGNWNQRTLTHTIRLHKNLTLEPGKVWKTSFLLDTRQNNQGKGVLQVLRIRGYLRPRLITAGEKKLSRYIHISPPLQVWVVEKPYQKLAKNSLITLANDLANLRKHSRELAKIKKRHQKVSDQYYQLTLDHRSLPKDNKDLRNKFEQLLALRKKERDDLARKNVILSKKTEEETIRVFYAATLAPENEKRKVIIQLSVALDDVSGKYARVLMVLLSYLTNRPLSFDKKQWIIWCFKKYRFSDQ